jgi:hypothetical protein
MACSQIPYATEQRIFFTEQRICFTEQRIFCAEQIVVKPAGGLPRTPPRPKSFHVAQSPPTEPSRLQILLPGPRASAFASRPSFVLTLVHETRPQVTTVEKRNL